MKKSTFSKPIRDNEKLKAQIRQEFPDWKLKHVDFTKEIRITKELHSLQISLLTDQTRLISGLNFFYSKLLLTLGVGFVIIVMLNEVLLNGTSLALSPIAVAIVFFVYLILLVLYYEKMDAKYNSKSLASHEKMEKLIKKMI